jgi:hypothetical protein
MSESLLNDLKRLQRATVSGRTEAIALIDEVRELRDRLVAARDGIGTELGTLQRGIAAFNAYGQISRRP